MDSVEQRLSAVYDLAAAGDVDAYQFLVGWHEWVHAIDDHVDQDTASPDVVGLCVQAAALFGNPFWLAYAPQLSPLVAVIAEKYRQSVIHPAPLDALRFAGNDMVLMVASIRGGPSLVKLVSAKLWPIVLETQCCPEPQSK